MNYQNIYTAGYGGREPQSLAIAARRLDALVCDIRLTPSWTQPGWGYKDLLSLLGARYSHVPNLGNKNHKERDKGVELFDAERGVWWILRLATVRKVILICCCPNPLTCHRHEVSRLLQRHGVTTQELTWPDVARIDWNELGSPDLPDIALSVKQFWAWLLANGLKDIENREWETNFRGRFLIHASKTLASEEWGAFCQERPDIVRKMPRLHDLDRGGVVGVATIKGCVIRSHSRWWRTENFGFEIVDAKPLPFTPLEGALKFFKPSEQLARMAARQRAKREAA